MLAISVSLRRFLHVATGTVRLLRDSAALETGRDVEKVGIGQRKHYATSRQLQMGNIRHQRMLNFSLLAHVAARRCKAQA